MFLNENSAIYVSTNDEQCDCFRLIWLVCVPYRRSSLWNFRFSQLTQLDSGGHENYGCRGMIERRNTLLTRYALAKMRANWT